MSVKEIVSLIDCEDYAPERVYSAVRQAVAPLGGIQTFVKPGQRVLLQVNLISARPPEDAVCTHPSVVQAVCRLVQEAGGAAFVGGSTAGWTSLRTDRVLRVSGIAAAAEAVGAGVINHDEAGGMDVPTGGKVLPTAHIAKPVLEADVLITLPKMKTHNLTLLTASVKNHLGTLPGRRKSEVHRRFPSPERFGEALLDIYTAAPPHLAIIDAVQGMDGEGPTQGRVRQVGLIAASADGVALDAVMCAVCGLDPKFVPTLVAARKRPFGVVSLDQIAVMGTPLEVARGRVAPFAYPSSYRLLSSFWVPRWAIEMVAKLSGAPMPAVVTERCTGCGTCVKTCPANAIAVVAKKARIEEEKCIACFCCHEVCESAAIRVKAPFLFRRADSN